MVVRGLGRGHGRGRGRGHGGQVDGGSGDIGDGTSVAQAVKTPGIYSLLASTVTGTGSYCKILPG